MSKPAMDWHKKYASPNSPWTPDLWRAYTEDGPDLDTQRRYRLSREPGLALSNLHLAPGDVVLEAGCGHGRITSHLMQKGVKVVACDISPNMVEFCRHRFAEIGSFHGAQADIGGLPFANGAFDKVLCSGVLMHVQDYRVVVAELCRVLRAGGTLVISLNSSFCPLIQLNSLQRPITRLLKKVLRFPPTEDSINFQASAPTGVVGFLKEQGVEVNKVQADTLFCGDYRIPKLGLSLLPAFGMPIYRAIDSLLVHRFPFSYFGWEIWFQGTKKGSAGGGDSAGSVEGKT